MSKRSSSKRVLKAVLKKLRFHPLRPQVSGYENTTLVNEVIRKTLLRRDEMHSRKHINLSELRSLAGFMLANLQEGSRVLDFGGGAGTHFDSLQQLYPEKSLEYFVIETEIMSSLAAKARLGDTNLHFLPFNHLSGFKPNFQVLIANSSLQYVEKPLDVLATLLDLSPEYVYITRCPLTQSKDQLSINQVSNLSDNGPSAKSEGQDVEVKYTANIVPYKDFKELLQKSHKILLEIKEEGAPFGNEYPDIDSWGFICKIN